jgi:hypothetical protein
VSLVCIPRVSPLKRAISEQLISVIYDLAGAALFASAEETKNMKIESNVSRVIRGVEARKHLNCIEAHNGRLIFYGIKLT